MANEQKAKLREEIGDVLFIDIVRYSKLLMDEQGQKLQKLNYKVGNTRSSAASKNSRSADSAS